MEEKKELESTIKTGVVLLLLRKKLNEIDSKLDPIIKNYAKDAIDFLPNIEPEKKPDVLRKLLLGNYDTYEPLMIDMSSFLREVRNLRQKSLDNATIQSIDGKDITSHTVAQNIELLEQLSYMSGYLGAATLNTLKYSEKIPLGNFWNCFFNYIRKSTQKEQQKVYNISKTLMKNALEESPDITIISIDYNPLLGYYTDEGSTDDYNDFLKKIDETTKQWYNIGMIRGRRILNMDLNQEDQLDSYIGLV
jgi:hypothetical protein